MPALLPCISGQLAGLKGKAPRRYILIKPHDQARCRIALLPMEEQTYNTPGLINQVQGCCCIALPIEQRIVKAQIHLGFPSFSHREKN